MLSIMSAVATIVRTPAKNKPAAPKPAAVQTLDAHPLVASELTALETLQNGLAKLSGEKERLESECDAARWINKPEKEYLAFRREAHDRLEMLGARVERTRAEVEAQQIRVADAKREARGQIIAGEKPNHIVLIRDVIGTGRHFVETIERLRDFPQRLVMLTGDERSPLPTLLPHPAQIPFNVWFVQVIELRFRILRRQQKLTERTNDV